MQICFSFCVAIVPGKPRAVGSSLGPVPEENPRESVRNGDFMGQMCFPLPDHQFQSNEQITN